MSRRVWIVRVSDKGLKKGGRTVGREGHNQDKERSEFVLWNLKETEGKESVGCRLGSRL